MGAVSLATSTYKPPEILSKIASDYSSTIESIQKQGFESPANLVVYRTPITCFRVCRIIEKATVPSNSRSTTYF